MVLIVEFVVAIDEHAGVVRCVHLSLVEIPSMTSPKKFSDGNALFKYALELICEDGVPSSPRGHPVSELPYPMVLILSDPSSPLITLPGRRANYRFGMAEAMWILSGREDLESLRAFNKRMVTFSDDGVRMWGAYGPRLMGQLQHVVSTLQRDRDSRQALVTTWRPMVHEVQPSMDCMRASTAHRALRSAGIMTESDVALSCETGPQRSMFPLPGWDGSSWRSKDVPCTVAWHFTVRDDALILTVFMRSNDVWLGLPYDLLSFTTVQRAVASMLGLRVGEYRHVVSNLHMYEHDRESITDVLTACSKSRKRIVLPEFALAMCNPTRVMQLANDTLTGTSATDVRSEPGFHAYYAVIHHQHDAWASARHVPVR